MLKEAKKVLSRDEISEIVKLAVAGKLGIKAAAIGDNSTLDELGADSLDKVELIIALEEAFDDYDIEINDEEADKLLSINLIIDYLDTAIKNIDK